VFRSVPRTRKTATPALMPGVAASALQAGSYAGMTTVLTILSAIVCRLASQRGNSQPM
jgi:hypothetical protein